MVTNTHITRSQYRHLVRTFVLGAGIGFVMQYASLTAVQQARLIPVVPSTPQTVQVRQTVRKSTVVSSVTRRKLLRSARNQWLRSYMVADTENLRRAAPDEPVMSTSSARSTAGSRFSAASSLAVQVIPAPVSTDGFPPFIKTSFPVSKAPDWGNMHNAVEWNRSYAQMTPADFVAIPAYSLSRLTIPMSSLTRNSSPEALSTITDKLFYSTRYFGAYDLDAGEFTAAHPGVDLKLPIGTPIGAIAGGRVLAVPRTTELGLFVMIEHRLGSDSYISIYGHLGETSVKAGDTVIPGQTIGYVGMTGNTSGAHLHLQIDRGNGSGTHTPYLPLSMPSAEEAAKFVVNPITFINTYRSGD